MKFCKDCEFLKNEFYCHAPQNGIDLISGRTRRLFAFERREAGVSFVHPELTRCGPAAIHFKAKTPPKKWWQRGLFDENI